MLDRQKQDISNRLAVWVSASLDLPAANDLIRQSIWEWLDHQTESDSVMKVLARSALAVTYGASMALAGVSWREPPFWIGWAFTVATELNLLYWRNVWKSKI